jgi:hypothetical protein
MLPFDRQRLLTALTLVVMALFVSSGMAPQPRWRRALRLIAIGGFALAVAVAVGEIAPWWNGLK